MSLYEFVRFGFIMGKHDKNLNYLLLKNTLSLDKESIKEAKIVKTSSISKNKTDKNKD